MFSVLLSNIISIENERGKKGTPSSLVTADLRKCWNQPCDGLVSHLGRVISKRRWCRLPVTLVVSCYWLGASSVVCLWPECRGVVILLVASCYRNRVKRRQSWRPVAQVWLTFAHLFISLLVDTNCGSRKVETSQSQMPEGEWLGLHRVRRT